MMLLGVGDERGSYMSGVVIGIEREQCVNYVTKTGLEISRIVNEYAHLWLMLLDREPRAVIHVKRANMFDPMC